MPSRRLLILGATGGTGREAVRQAVAADWAVTVLVRDPRRLTAASGIEVVTGDVRDPSSLGAAVANQDAVISALGVGQSFTPDALIARAAPAIVAAMERHGVRRLVFTSAFGVGATYGDVPLLPRLFIGTLLRRIYADKAAGEEAILRSALDWTIVYPAGLTNGPRTGTYRVGEHLRLSGFPRISRADVGELLVRLAGEPAFVRKQILAAQ